VYPTLHKRQVLNQIARLMLPAFIVLLLAACGAVPEVPDMEDVEAPEMPTDMNLADVPDAIRQVAVSALANYLDSDMENLVVIGAESREWPSSALGCPAEDQVYMQVITPGYRLVLQGPEGQEYALHTTQTGTPLILCQNDEPTQLLP
jgi:hypothetical protein